MIIHTFARTLAISATITAVVSLSSCTQYQQQGAGLGALGGAALGAIAGDDSGDVLRGAAIGAAVGTGAAAYQENQNKAAGRYNTGGDNYKPKPQASLPPSSLKNYPVARQSVDPNIVISPYTPNNPIDISGLSKTATLAKDTSTGKIFRIPGR